MGEDAAVWVIATGNPGKRREIETILAGRSVRVLGLEGFPTVVFPEEGTGYRDNAIEKARAVANQIGQVAVGDDSGIEVDALNGGPGPLSARYGGDGLDDRGRVRKLLDAIRDVEPSKRAARFVCYAALATPEGDVVVAYGECRGTIMTEPRGEGGFGYDPVFQPEGYAQSMAEIDSSVKNRISHRARAFHDLYARWAGS